MSNSNALSLDDLDFSELFDSEEKVSFEEAVKYAIALNKGIQESAIGIERSLDDSEATVVYSVFAAIKKGADASQKAIKDALMERAVNAGGRSDTDAGSINRSVTIKTTREYVEGHESFLEKKGILETCSDMSGTLKPDLRIEDLPAKFVKDLRKYFDVETSVVDSRVEALKELGILTTEDIDQVFVDVEKESSKLLVTASKTLADTLK
jgi:hypothetical protein